MQKRLAVLISNSGAGTNIQAIIDAISEKKLNAKIAVVVSDTPDAQGLMRASKSKIQTLVLDKKIDLRRILRSKYQVDFIVLAGWKQIIPDSMINEFKILNIHPGLIPDSINGVVKNPDGTDALWNKGKFTILAIEEFLKSKSTYAGSTVHLLSHEFDFGEVLERVFEKIEPDDTVESLYGRLKGKENEAIVNALIKLCNE